MTRLSLHLLLPLLVLLQGQYGCCDREAECIEVGFARSAGSYLGQGYNAAKEEMLARWAEEDLQGKLAYLEFTPLLKNVTRTGLLLEEASRRIVALVRKTRVGKRCIGDWILKGVEKHVIPLINLDKELAEEMGLVMSFRCLVGSPYPNVDGSCVNQESPDLGSVGSKFLRLQPSTMASDGFSLRGSSHGEEATLPSAREVARLVRKHIKRPSITGIFTEWAHFVQRDTFSIPESPLAESVDCCSNPSAEDCAPIPVAQDDPLHALLPCIPFRRSARAQAILGHREALSMVSTYLDATPVYGPTDKVAFTKKTGYFGFLKSPEQAEEGEEKKPEKNKCAAPESFEGCFDLGEGEDWVAGLRLLLVLEHNRIADALAELNPHFDDSLLYNEARRILIAEYAHVTFGEYLEVLLGKATQEKHSLHPGAQGHGASFIPEVNPGILASFALASYRNPAMLTEWKQEWGQTEVLESAHYNSILNDPYQDLLAMDVQRARDQGVAGYKVWRQFCHSEGNYNSWEDFVPTLGQALVDDLKELYQGKMEDVEAVVGVLEEGASEGAAVAGRTYTCLLADQFARLKSGNRLYWEHETSMLTQEQKDYVSGVTLAHLLCNNLHLHASPKNAFLPPSDSNPLVPCSDLPPGDLSPWKDTSLIERMKQLKEEEAEAAQKGKMAGVLNPAKTEPRKEL